MSLLQQDTKYPSFKTAQGMKYPWAYDAWKTHQKMHWREEEVPLADDVKDYQNDTPEGKEFITNVMKLFTQSDIQVGSGYDVLLRIFKPTEVQMMLRTFADRECTHISAYALFTETIGLPTTIYTDFLDIPVMERKIDYIEKAKVHKWEDYLAMGLTEVDADRRFRKDVARMLAVYGGLVEGVSLFAQFAMLLKYQTVNKYKGLCTIVDWSIKDENEHSVNNSRLFREFIKENMDIWDDELKYDIYEAARQIVQYEHALVDYFNPPHMNKEELHRFIEYITDERLKGLGMKPNYNIPINPLPFMDELLHNVTLTNFFEARVVDYTKGAIQGSWEELRAFISKKS